MGDGWGYWISVMVIWEGFIEKWELGDGDSEPAAGGNFFEMEN
jgi:hypothetical protein